MHAHVRELVIVEARALELLVLKRVAERFDEMQAATRVRGEADHVAGVRRNLGLVEDDVEHWQAQSGGDVRAMTQFTTCEAPAAFNVAAISSRVAPVVMTSSTTATLAPTSDLLQRKAPRTLRSRSDQGRSICGGASRPCSHRSSARGA